MTLAKKGYIFVPDEGFTSVIHISAPQRARAGEWIPLSATRTNGPWKQVRGHLSLGHRGRPCVLVPREFEPEVAANLVWIVDPPGIARFNLPIVLKIRHQPMARSVMFHEPGAYKICGLSFDPIDALSNVLTINVG